MLFSLICWSACGVVAWYVPPKTLQSRRRRLTKLPFHSITAAYLHYLNKKQAARRRRMGKAAEVIDTSILTIEAAAIARHEKNEKEGVTNDQAFDDLTDFENEDFVYVL